MSSALSTTALQFTRYPRREATLEAIPAAMRDAPRWMCYALEPDPKHADKPRKVPKNARTGYNAASTRSETWTTFDRAVQALHDNSALHGLGFALGDGWVGVDLDHCVKDNGELEPWARELVERLDSYTEFSPSGSGVHVIVRGQLPEGWRKMGNVEMYETGRFFTVSGSVVPDAPLIVSERAAVLAALHEEREQASRVAQATRAVTSRGQLRAATQSDEALIQRAKASKRGNEFARLWDGDHSAFPSQSEADLALCSALMFWSNGDSATADRLFRQSGLYRPKWDEMHGHLTYGQRTITTAHRSWQDRAQQSRVADEEGQEAPGASEDAIASLFTERSRDTLRYTAEYGAWYQWDGVSCWKEDTTLHVFDLVRGVCREVAATLQPKQAAIVSRASTIAAVERLAKADRAHAATSQQWDADAWLLNTPSGVVDLRSGVLRRGLPTDYLTRQTAVAPMGHAPTWLKFLERVTGEDADLQAFLQRMAGYALTGDISAHALFFLYGTGANGKGTFINTLTSVLGDYATVSPIETFTASQNDRHPTELAMLKGARLVASQETEQGRRWAEAKLKAITGGDPITARFMRGDFFTFNPQFKLIIAGNHRPHLRNVDEAMRRRLHLVPFTQTIPADERDPQLPEKLKAEWPGILAWAIDGCLAWQAFGLRAPESVKVATNDYFSAEDSIQAWIDESCIAGAQAWAPSQTLFQSWQRFAEERGEAPGTMKSFIESLKNRGYVTGKRGGSRGISGLAITPREDYPRVS